MYMYTHTCMYNHVHAVFPPKGGNMALPDPLVLLPHLVMLKFILKNNTD